MAFQKISIPTERGKELAVVFQLPSNDTPTSFLIFTHSFSENNISVLQNICQPLLLKGFGVLCIRVSGIKENGSMQFDPNLEEIISDISAAANFLNEHYCPPTLLMGHCAGSAINFLASSKIPSLKAFVTIGAPAKEVTLPEQVADAWENQDIKDIIHGLNLPMLIFHSPTDQVVHVDHAAFIFVAAQHPKSFISLDHADHFLSDKSDAVFTGNMIGSWIDKYISISPKEVKSTEGGKHVVTETHMSDFLTAIKTDHHGFLADEPINAGGNDAGPDPYELLLGSLGACTGMTLRLYANHKKWPVESIKVHLQHYKTYAEDCEHCEEKNGKIDKIDRTINIAGDLDENQLQRLLEIADKCPVHKTMEAQIQVETKVKKL